MVTANLNLLSRGIYTPKQAAKYARLRTQTLLRWIHGTSAGEPAVRAELGNDPDQFVTFYDLIQAMAIRSIRLTRQIPLQLIRQAVTVAENQYGISYPFARKHTTYLFDDDIVIRLPDETLIQVTGKYHDNHLITPVVELYAEDLVYEHGPLPTQYKAFSYKDRTVVFDPSVRFGEPVVSPCDLRVDDLATAAVTEGSAENAAEAYGVDREDVNAALRFNDWLLGVAA